MFRYKSFKNHIRQPTNPKFSPQFIFGNNNIS